MKRLILRWLFRVRLWEISLVVLIGFCSYFVWNTIQESKQVTQETVTVLSHVDRSLTSVDFVVSTTGNSLNSTINGAIPLENKINYILDRVAAPCVPIKGLILSITDNKNCGTLANVDRTLQTLRGTIGTIEVAGLNFDKHQGQLYSQEKQIFDDTDTLIKGFVPIQNKIDKTIFDTDNLITSSDITGTIHHFNIVSGNLADSSTDFQNKFHAFLFPPPCEGFRCHVGEIIQGARIASQFAEPGYWAYQWATH